MVQTFELVLTPRDVISTVRRGEISTLVGIEGGHQLGNSRGALRHFAARGVRYVTLTHTCHNAFADSSGLFDVVEPLDHGPRCAFLPIASSQWNRRTVRAAHSARLVRELNRLGVPVGLSHTSDDIAPAALKISRGTRDMEPLFYLRAARYPQEGAALVCRDRRGAARWGRDGELSSGFVSGDLKARTVRTSRPVTVCI
ncbi:membrane dipeptidase-domain-containing protein [Lactarius deliciosus]|nr:membrane dipeptidase-domain-containing protein [Lactarius deliciosus]